MQFYQLLLFPQSQHSWWSALELLHWTFVWHISPFLVERNHSRYRYVDSALWTLGVLAQLSSTFWEMFNFNSLLNYLESWLAQYKSYFPISSLLVWLQLLWNKLCASTMHRIKNRCSVQNQIKPLKSCFGQVLKLVQKSFQQLQLNLFKRGKKMLLC